MIYRPNYVYRWDLYTEEEQDKIYEIEIKYNEEIEIKYNEEIEIVTMDDKITEAGIEIIDNYISPLIIEMGVYYCYYNLNVDNNLYKRLHKNLTKRAISYEEYYKEAIIREIIE